MANHQERILPHKQTASNMALNNTPADLLPALEPTEGEQRGEETLARSLPYVALDRILYFVSDTPTLLTIATISQDFKDICRPHLSMHYEKLPAGERFLYHHVLQLVLEGYVDPSYIYEIDCEDAKLFRGGVERGQESLEDFQYKYDAVRSEEDPDDRKRHVLSLLRGAVSMSPWLSDAREDEVCEQFQFCDPDAALAVLLPLCTKLKTLEIPRYACHCAAVVQAVAQAYCQRGITGAEARRSAWEAALRDRAAPVRRRSPEPDVLPFSELMVLHTRDRHWVGCWLPLSDVTAFMGIPSLHRVVLDAIRDRDFSGWPAEHVKCSCPEIWLHRSSCTPRAIRAFAEGMANSCEIRQQFDLHGRWVQEEQQAELTWDSVLVSRREDGSKDIEMRIAFDGGDPGYEHGWVSWMWWGRMQDWRRLDEEFSVQEGDNHVVELGAGLWG